MVLLISYYFSNLAAVVCMRADVWNEAEKKSSNIVVPGEGPSQPVVFSGHKCHTAKQRMSEADKSKVESGQYSIVYGHRSRGWRHTMARGNAHKLSET